MCYQPALPVLSVASYLLSWTCMSQDFFNNSWDQCFSTVGISSSPWTLSVCVKAWEALLEKTGGSNALSNSAQCVSVVLFLLSSASPCLFSSFSSRSSCCCFLPIPAIVELHFPNVILTCLDSILYFSFVAFLLASISFVCSFYTH